MNAPVVLVALANAGKPVRPAGASAPTCDDPLADAAAASRLLRPLLGRRVEDSELPRLRQLRDQARDIADALIGGTAPQVEALNGMAADPRGRLELRVARDGTLHSELLWEPGPAADQLARQLIAELAGLNPARLRRCARPECELVFYDTTRSATQRWHSESPCGWRERQQRSRRRAAARSA